MDIKRRKILLFLIFVLFLIQNLTRRDVRSEQFKHEH